MADLVAQSEDTLHRWRRALVRDVPVILGRQQAHWTVPWDHLISRQHAKLLWDGQLLQVEKLASARNPIFILGHSEDRFTIHPGQHFVIGSTTFSLAQSTVGATLQMPDPVQEKLFSRQVLNQVRFQEAERRLAILGDLPEMIAGANTDTELYVHLCNVIFGGALLAKTVAVVAYDDSVLTQRSTQSEASVQVLHWDCRFGQGDTFQPSQRLIQAAMHREQSVLHVWDDHQTIAARTMIDPSQDWAFVTPLESQQQPRLGLYVSGQQPSGDTQDSVASTTLRLQEDIKFTELVANILGSLLSLRSLQTRQSSLRSFFSPVVLDALQTSDPQKVLQARECEVAVLFCDLRGFSAASEKMSGDLMQLLARVSQALGVTTGQILNQRGVVGDFHGDATMGFWGWPLPQQDRALRACQAAIDIHRQFSELATDQASPLHGFQLGLGIASGNAVAGQIGTADQVKVTAFGPVVNLAARLETMNRQLNTSILIDQATVDGLQQQWRQQTQSTPPFRLRRLGNILPAGLTQPIGVSEVLPRSPQSPLTDEHLSRFDAALTSFQDGDWEAAYQQLHEVPSHDRAKDLLTLLITQNNRRSPENWDGIIRLQQK